MLYVVLRVLCPPVSRLVLLLHVREGCWMQSFMETPLVYTDPEYSSSSLQLYTLNKR